MRILKLCLMLMLLPLAVACFDDKSTDATLPISEITIKSGIDSIYNIAKNETIVILPVVSQTGEEKVLSYTWEVDLEEVSNDTVFEYTGASLGNFNCRLIVENEDGKTFFPFTINVNSPYEEGITILSRDADGKSMISFMQKPVAGEQAKFYTGDCFAINNPKEKFAAGAVDIVQCRNGSGSGNWLIVACQGGGEDNDLPTFYYMNEKTFEVENSFTVSDYPDFKPVKLGITPVIRTETSYPVLCENGKVYDFSIGEADIIQPRKLQSEYAMNNIVSYGSSSYEILLWDKTNKGLSLIYNGYGPYYCSKPQYHLMLSDKEFASKNYFANRNLVAMSKIRMTPSQLITTGGRNEFLIITSVSIIARSEVLYTDFWGYDQTYADDVDEKKYPMMVADTHSGAMATSPIGVETPCIANKTYTTLLFADGNKVRVWNYSALPSDFSKLINADVLYTIDSESAVITGFEISDDHKKTYVAYYEPDSENELNGSLVVIDTDTGALLEEYKNISYQPVKIIYKTK